MPTRYVRSKWDKTRILLNTSLKPHIPETARYELSRLIEMLNRYGMVYVKPNVGTHGNGVMRIKKRSDGSFELREGTTTKTFHTSEQLHAQMLSSTSSRKYLIQQGINLLAHQERIFDLRVLVQRNLQDKWEVMYIFGRKAAANKIVTNTNNGGKIEALSVVMKPHMDTAKLKHFKSQLKQIGLAAGKHLKEHYPGIKELGLDIALDKSLHPWILEVNTRPAINVYRDFDPVAYRTILRYAKGYGRNK